MATLPAEVSGASLPVEAGGVPLGRTGILRGEFVSGLGALPAVRQVGLLVGIAASIALGVALVLWLQTPDYRPITGGYDTYDNQAVTELLEQNSIQFRIDSRSGMVLVDAGRFDEARIALAQADLLGSAAAQGAALTEPPPFGSSVESCVIAIERPVSTTTTTGVRPWAEIRCLEIGALQRSVRPASSRAGGAA